MKNILFTLTVLCLLSTVVSAQGELYIPPTGSIFTTGASTLTFSNAKLTNNGSFTDNNGTVLFTGNASNANASFNGTGTTTFKNLTIDKSANNGQVNQDIIVLGNLTLVSGGLELANGDVNFSTTGSLQGETETFRVYGAGGELIAFVTLNGPAAVNHANLGAVITSAQNLGLTEIRRGHAPSAVPFGNSFLRYFNILPTNNNGLNATLRVNYFNAEVNGNSENDAIFWRSTNGGVSWVFQNGAYSRDVAANWVQLPGINAFSLWTLADPPPCPDFAAAPANVTVVNSVCNDDCVIVGGSIVAPAGTPCPEGSTLQYRVNSGQWTTTIPVYSQTGPGQFIQTRCSCNEDGSNNSPVSSGVTTAPAACVPASTNLVCNDLVTVALDESCMLELNADMILEGANGCLGYYLVQLDRTLPLGNGPWTSGVLGAGDVHHTYAVRVVVDLNENGIADPNENTCWGNIAIEDKLPPVINCPCSALTDNNCTYTCADKDGILNGSIATPLPMAVDGCEGPITTVVTNPNAPGANLYKKDVFIAGADACSPARIERTWTAKDSWGNSAQCTQIFYLEPFNLDDVDFPEDITINCAGCGITANTLPCETGVPTVEGFDADGVYQILQYNGNCQVISEGLCNLGAQYEDTKIIVCAGTFKILRHWTVLDWCTNTVLEYDQLIKVVDNVGPVITPVPDMTVSTNPSQCCATVNLPNTIIEDACSGTAAISAMVTVYDQYLPGQVVATYNLNNLNQFFLSNFPGNNFWDCDTLGNFGNTPCLPIGTHEVMYIAEDVCGNTSTESFLLTVVDDVPPVATCTEFTTVAIGVDDPTDCYEPTGACEFAGVTWVPATAFDQGSHDNCSPIEFTIRRMKEADGSYSDCIDNLASLCNGYEYTNIATAENDSIKFYCCEVGTTQTVILRVYQLDINGNRDYYRNDDGTPLTDPDGVIQYIYNECMIQVEVQDKIKPVCQPPAHVTVSCENFEPTLWAYGYPTALLITAAWTKHLQRALTQVVYRVFLPAQQPSRVYAV